MQGAGESALRLVLRDWSSKAQLGRINELRKNFRSARTSSATGDVSKDVDEVAEGRRRRVYDPSVWLGRARKKKDAVDVRRMHRIE